MTVSLMALVAVKTGHAELRRCHKTLSFAWSLAVLVAGWASLCAQYSAFPTFLAYL